MSKRFDEENNPEELLTSFHSKMFADYDDRWGYQSLLDPPNIVNPLHSHDVEEHLVRKYHEKATTTS